MPKAILMNEKCNNFYFRRPSLSQMSLNIIGTDRDASYHKSHATNRERELKSELNEIKMF